MPQSQSRAQFGINASWLSDTIRECQAFLGESVSLVPSDLRATAGRFIERLPNPSTPLETLTQKGLLLDLAIQFGYAAHKAFHQHAGPGDRSSRRCGFQPAASLGEWPRDSTRSPSEAFHRWASRFGFEKDLYRVVQARVGCTPLEFRKRLLAANDPSTSLRAGQPSRAETAYHTTQLQSAIRHSPNDRQRRGA